MARPKLHPTDGILDAARDLVLDAGVAAASVSAIARASGAPMGSLYHRFGSHKDLLGQLWIRAVRRSQEGFLAALDHPDAVEAAVGAALSVLRFCVEEPADARMLVSFRREDLCRGAATPALVEELRELNRPLEQALRDLTTRLYGSPAAIDRTVLATVDLPHGAVRRHLVDGRIIPATVERYLTTAVRAVLGTDTRS